MEPIIECVPNFSEGKNQFVIDSIANAIREVEGVKLLHIDSGEAANRTVYTFIGTPQSVFDAAFNAIKVASQLIDMQSHQGVHPRIGACDVCPFIPIKNISLEELISMHSEFAKRVAEELKIPVYLYENSALKSERKNLAWIRKGEYENLAKKMQQDDFIPDMGEPKFNAKSGILITGVRNFLIAYNINLATLDVSIAQKIASIIREKSQTGLKGVRAIGWYLEDYDRVQVSTNIVDYSQTSIFEVFEKVKKLAKLHNTMVTGSELIGLIPLAAISKPTKNEISLEKKVALALKELGLDDLKPFIASERVLELAIAK